MTRTLDPSGLRKMSREESNCQTLIANMAVYSGRLRTNGRRKFRGFCRGILDILVGIHEYRRLYFGLIVTIILSGMLFVMTLEPYSYTPHFVVANNVRIKHLIDHAKEVHATNDFSVKRVPKILHYTWGAGELRFHQMVCFLSAYHVIKPYKTIIWYARSAPSGKWWNYVMRNITDFRNRVQLRHYPDPVYIHGRMIGSPEHRSDIVRMRALNKFGGIYLDFDVLVLKPFDPLLVYPMTMGLESSDGLCNGIMLSETKSAFLQAWYEEYKTYTHLKWVDHSVKIPFLLARRYPWLVHVEENTLNKPSWFELDQLYGNKFYDWSKNYAIHLWFRNYGVHHDFTSIRKANSTFGQIFRFILFGSPKLL
jgi:hypothetical protein